MFDVIIIGGGWSGIFTLKHCLEQKINVICLEQSSEYGGVWNVNNSPAVYPNTYSVTSKHYLSISDFPIPEDYPEFPHHSLVYNYMKMYVKHFKLSNYIKLNCKVENIKKKDSIWNISFMNYGAMDHISSKYIAICTGQNSRCINMPDIDYSKFEGTIIHANDYDETFRKDHCVHKKVLVYGGSDTGADIADELTSNMYSHNENTQVVLSFKKGRWIQRRNTGSNAADMFYSRSLNFIIKLFSKQYIIDSIFLPYLEYWWGKGGSNIKEWQPKAGYLNSYYVKSSNIVNKVALGEIIPKGNIKKIHSNSVTFIDGTKESIDTIIFATGYDGFNCMYEIPDNIKQGSYYDHIFLIEDPTVVKVGFIRPYLTSIPMLIEMQSKYISLVFADKIKLPSTMQYEYDQMKQKQELEFNYDYKRVQGIVDPYDYMDLIARKINAIPHFIWLHSFNLWKQCMFGTWSQYYYSLNHKNKKVRDIAEKQIMELQDHPTSTYIYSLVLYSIIKLIVVVVFIVFFIFLLYKYVTSNGKSKLKNT